MKKVLLTLPLVLVAFMLPPIAGAQEKENIVKFQVQSGELQGQIRLFEPQSGLLIVERNSIPYSFNVTPATKILVCSQKAKIENLADKVGKSVTVKFRAERKGNIATELSLP